MQVQTQNPNILDRPSNTAGSHRDAPDEINPAPKLVNRVKQLEEIFSKLHGEQETEESEKQENLTSVINTLNLVREKYPVVLNWFTVALHSAASSLPFIPFVSKELSKKVKEWAIVFSRYVVPLNMVHNAIEDLMGKRLFHAIARLAPPACLPFLPFFNFSMPYGIYAGINFPSEEILKRVGELDNKSTFAENNKKVIDGLKAMWSDVNDKNIHFKERFRLGSIFFASASMLGGALGGLLFSPNSLNNFSATVFGFIRSMGGLIGDLNLILAKNSTKKEKAIGSLYAVGSLMDITQRWIVDPTINELYNHFKTSLNTISTMLWTHMSTERNRQQEKKEKHLLHAKPVLQAA